MRIWQCLSLMLKLSKENMRGPKNIWKYPWVVLAMLSLATGGIANTQARVVPASQAAAEENENHRLMLYNTHTAERIDIVYRGVSNMFRERSPSWIISCAIIRPMKFAILIHGCTTYLPISRHRWGFPMGRSTSSVVIALRRRTNRCGRTLAASQKTACTFKRKRSTCAYPASTR